MKERAVSEESGRLVTAKPLEIEYVAGAESPTSHKGICFSLFLRIKLLRSVGQT
jgi:hypothetical protein